MPYAYRCDHIAEVTITVASGVITRTDMLEHVRRQVTDPEWPAGRVLLSDYRLIEGLVLTASDFDDAARLYAPKASRIVSMRTLYVASRSFGDDDVVQRMFARRYGTGPALRPDIETACSELGIDPIYAHAVIAQLRDELANRDAPAA